MKRAIDLKNEVWFTTARAGGKGGQHVNKVETKVFVWLDINASSLFSEAEKNRIKKALSSSISKEGILHLACQNSRSQLKNKKFALLLLEHKIRQALVVPKVRKALKIPKSVLDNRRKAKKIRSEVKSLRGKVQKDKFED